MADERKTDATPTEAPEQDLETLAATEAEEADLAAEGVAGEAEEASGTVPGSVGGTTGTSGHAGGIQTPGASEPPVRGIDPDEVRGKVGHRRPKDGE